MKKLLNQTLALIQLAYRRTIAGIGSYLAIALGVLVATTTITSLIVYSESVNVAVLRDRLSQSHEEANFDMLIKGTARMIDYERYQRLNSTIMNLVENKVGLPVTHVSRHGWSKPLTIILPGVNPDGHRNELPRTRFQFYSGSEDKLDLIAGRFPQHATDPQAVVEVMMTQKLAQQLNLKIDDEFSVEDFKGGDQSIRIRTRLAGIVKPKETAQSFFYAPWFLDEALTIPEESYFKAIAITVVPTEAEVTWVANYDERAINITNVTSVLNGLNQLRFAMNNQLNNMQMLTSLDAVLNDYRTGTFMLKALLIMLGAPIIGIALYYITMSADLLVEYQRSEIAVLKSRGSDTKQVLALFFVQGLLIVVPVALIAPLLSLPVAQLIGKAETFMVFSNPRILPVALRGETFAYAALAGFLALLAIFVPALKAAQATVVTYRREMARSKYSTFIHRFYLDVLLVLLGVVGYRMLGQGSSIITRNAQGGLQFDPMLLLTPIALVVGMAFLVLRFIPLLFRLLARIVSLTDQVAPLFAVRQVARSSNRYNGLILILTFTLAIGLFTTSVANAFDRNYLDQAMYTAGADLRTREFDFDKVDWIARPIEEYRAISGVEQASPAMRVTLVGRAAQIEAKGSLLAIDLETIQDVIFWRQDFEPSIGEVIRLLNTHENALLADRKFVNKYRLKIGETFDIDVKGKRVDFVLAGTFDLFPTLYQANGSILITRLDYLQGVTREKPNEVWITTSPSQHNQVIAALRAEKSKNSVFVENGHQLSGVRKEDPLRTGLFGALSLGFISSALLSILGFLLYAYVSIQSRSLQFGVLRATGLSVRQLMGALSTEQLSLIGLGVVIGSLLGAGAGWMFTRFLQLSIIAKESIPPFLVTTPWTTIILLYIILSMIFALALLFSIYLLRRMRVSSVLRLGEQ